ncbi:small subunit processome component 20, partial [Schistosoma japonicum]
SYRHVFPDYCCVIMRIIDLLIHILVNNPANRAYFVNCRYDLQTGLLPLLMSFSHQIRLHVLRVLLVINSDLVNAADHTTDSHQRSDQNFPVQNIVEQCLKAERVQLGPQTVRNFLMHILQLHADRDVKHCRQAAEIAIHYLFGLLHIQFTAIWSPVYEAIASYCESSPLLKRKSTVRETSSNHSENDDKHWSIECRDLFWSVFQPLLMDVEAKIVDTNDKDIQEVSNSKETNLYTCSYETAIIWFTSIRPDLYSLLRKTPKNDILLIESRKPPNWLSYRLCLWQCLRWKVAAKYTHFLTPLLLNIISSAIQSGLNKSTEHILYGRLQLSKGQFTSAIFTNLALCTDSELNLFLSFLLDPFVKEADCAELSTNSSVVTLTTSKALYDSIQLARQRVKQTIHGSDTLSWSRLHALSQVINQLLNYLGHRLNIINLNENELINTTDNEFQPNPTDLSNDIQRADILLRLALTLLAMVYEVKQIKLESLIKPVGHHHHNQLPLTSQLKSIRSAGINLLVHLFSSKWLCNIQFWGNSISTISITTNDTIDNNNERSTIVKHVCCNSFVLMNLLKSSTLSLNHLLIQLSYVWSLNEYLCIQFFDKSLLSTLLTLLNMHYNCTLKLKNEIIEKLIEIIHNLIFLPGVCTIGRILLQPYHSELITYLNKRLQELCQAKSTFFVNLGKKPQSGLRLQHEFQLISYLAQLPYTNINTDNKQSSTNYLTQEDGEKLLEALLQLLQRSSIRSLRRTTATNKPALFKRLSSGNIVNSDESAARYDFQLATGEAVEAELIQSIIHLVQIATNITEYL